MLKSKKWVKITLAIVLSIVLLLSAVLITDKIFIRNIFDEMYYCAKATWDTDSSFFTGLFIGRYLTIVEPRARDESYSYYIAKCWDQSVREDIVKEYTQKENSIIEFSASCTEAKESPTFHYKKNYISIHYYADISIMFSYDFDKRTLYYSSNKEDSETLKQQADDFLNNVIAKMWSDNNPQSRFSPDNLGRFKMVEGEMPKS